MTDWMTVGVAVAVNAMIMMSVRRLIVIRYDKISGYDAEMGNEIID